MGWSGNGGRKKTPYSNPWSARNRQRMSMSFFLVVMFFILFATIILTEVFFPGERARGRQDYRHDYDDMQNEEYISLKNGPALDETVRELLNGQKSPLTLNQKKNTDIQKQLSESQLPQYPYNLTPTEGEWQIVNGTKFKFFVYAAYVEQRKGLRGVRIIGATRTRAPDRVWCRLWYRVGEGNTSNTYISKTIPAKLRMIRENWNLKYSAYFVLCPLKSESFPTYVSIVTKITHSPSNLLSVMDNYNNTNIIPTRYTVCIKPLHYNYDRYLELIEFIELNVMLGVSHFTFYNHTIGPQVACVLQHYISKGVVTVLPWQLDIVSQKEIRTEGIFASLNDCLYRYMYKASHALFIDLDEFIVPKHNHTLPQLIEYMNAKMINQHIGSHSFQNAFFYRQWNDDDYIDTLDDPLIANLIALRKTRRKSKLYPHKQRSKYICQPEKVVEVGNHFIWEFMPGYGSCNVPGDVAILHHYRICEYEGDDCIKTTSVLDRTIYRYKDDLVSAVRREYDLLKERCALVLPTFPPKTTKEQVIYTSKGGS